MSYYCKFEILQGKTLTNILNTGDELIFTTTEEEVFKMLHYQDCCEYVYIEDIIGELDWLVGSPILMAEEVSEKDEKAGESGTWTFYKLATINGYVTIRWYGESNGYYSEDVDFVRVS